MGNDMHAAALSGGTRAGNGRRGPQFAANDSQNMLPNGHRAVQKRRSLSTKG
ncbi:hypothetical protein [Sphingopyxis terrae]|uniref:hypothetical protein n=1 Tax=Sphingopyxis terrae TaxID=33052 RepID=UPI00362F7597